MLSMMLANPYDLFEDLIDDVYKTFELLESDRDSQYLKRVAVRAIFSFLECVPYQLKYKIRKDYALEKLNYNLTKKDLESLFEDKENSNSKYRVTFTENFKDIFKLALKSWELESFDLKFDTDFQKLTKSIKVRDRITHPKRHDDILISDDEFILIIESFEYVKNLFIELLQKKLEINK